MLMPEPLPGFEPNLRIDDARRFKLRKARGRSTLSNPLLDDVELPFARPLAARDDRILSAASEKRIECLHYLDLRIG